MAYGNDRSVRPRSFLLTAMLFLGGLLAGAGHGQAAHYALTVGIDTYSPVTGWPSLSSCVNDAIGIRTNLLADSVRWQADHVTTLTDASAGEGAVRAALLSLAATAKAGDVVVYFHSSHGGVYESSAFLCAYDALYFDSELAADLDCFEAGVTVIVILDACSSGGMFQPSEEAPIWPFADNVMRQLGHLREAQGRIAEDGAEVAWMAACREDETCMAGSVYSLFTKYVIDGFGHADTDDDQRVTFKEIFDYAAPRALVQNPKQHAQSLNDGVLDAKAAIGDDDYEENDTMAGAFDPGFDWRDRWLSSLGGPGIQRDFDVYRFSLGTADMGGRLVVTCRFEHAEGDINLALFDSATNLLTFSASGDDDETLMVHVAQTGRYDVVVFYGNAGNAYDLTWCVQSNRTMSVPEAIDTHKLGGWEGGASPWIGQTSVSYDGVDAAESGVIDDAETSRFDRQVEGPGTLTFRWRVSSELDYDELGVYLDDVRQATLSGETDWTPMVLDITSGAHTVSWRYVKDDSVSVGFDCGWIDQVVYVPSDGDGDGLPDWWELRYFDSTTAGNPGIDSDDDGVKNGAEYDAGTHPRDPSNCLRMEIPQPVPDGGTVITWSSVSNRYYGVDRCTNPAVGGFDRLAAEIPGQTGTTFFVDPDVFVHPVFYRVWAIE